MNNRFIKNTKHEQQNICSVCIATFKRPVLLRKLIQSLFDQKSIDDTKLEIIIVDNDVEKSAKEIVAEFSDTSSVTISYYEQPIQNISLTRNMAIDKSSGRYLAIIDDDETADKHWIRNLIDAIIRFDADAVFGYVLPVFPHNSPVWLQQREVYFLPMGKTGDPPSSFPTTNCMIKSDKVNQFNVRFDPKYGLSGGGDQVFFRLLSTYGAKYVICREAITYEIVPAHRTKLKSICSRNIQKGNSYGRIVIESSNSKFYKTVFILTIKSLLGIGYYGLQSLIFLPFRRKWIFSLICLCLNVGKLLAIFKLNLLIYKTDYSN
jgi:succinoglycan biosynthesis protein ExoM